MLNSTQYTSSKHLSWFRLLFGVLMLPQIYNLIPHVKELGNSCIVFHYPGLEFIEAYSYGLINFLAIIGAIGAILLALGVIPRIGALIFLICFGYLFLIDVSFYNNHYYLWCLISFLFLFVDHNNCFKAWELIKKGNLDRKINIQSYLPFAILITIVYFYGGVAKINEDWLQGYPMRLMTQAKGVPFPDITGYFLSYSGLIFDLLIGFVLWKYPKKIYVIIPYFGFHLSNYFIFNIGEFPLVMMAAWLLFANLCQVQWKDIIEGCKTIFLPKNAISMVLALFLIIQFIYPIRPLVFGEKVAWDRQGYDFTWRMMLNNYEPNYFQFLVEFPNEEQNYHVDFSKLLTYRQFYHAYHDPYMIWTLAQKLKTDAVKKYEEPNVKIHCKSLVQLNQHSAKQLINQDVDLASVDFNHFRKNQFINLFQTEQQ